jgi:hypothetical protein
MLFTVEYTLKDTWNLGRQISHLSVQTKPDSFFKPALLRSKTSTTCESDKTCSQMVPNSNLGWVIGYPMNFRSILQSLPVNTGAVP